VLCSLQHELYHHPISVGGDVLYRIVKVGKGGRAPGCAPCTAALRRGVERRATQRTGRIAYAECDLPLRSPASRCLAPSNQNNEKYNCGCDRTPLIFGAPRVGPPTVVARATSTVKVTICHRKANVLSFGSSVSPGSGRNKGPVEAGPEEEPFRSFYANGGDSSFEPATYSKPKPPLLSFGPACGTSLLSAPTRAIQRGRAGA
jgi:hypothetical protein